GIVLAPSGDHARLAAVRQPGSHGVPGVDDEHDLGVIPGDQDHAAYETLGRYDRHPLGHARRLSLVDPDGPLTVGEPQPDHLRHGAAALVPGLVLHQLHQAVTLAANLGKIGLSGPRLLELGLEPGLVL